LPCSRSNLFGWRNTVTLLIAEFVLRLPGRDIVPDVFVDHHDKDGFWTSMRQWMRRGLSALVDASEPSILRRPHPSDSLAQDLPRSSSQNMDWTASRVFSLMQWQRLPGVEADRT
jgi:hypothetical protein